MNVQGKLPPFLGNGAFVRCACSDGEDLAALETIIRDDYERARPGDTWGDLMSRAQFSKEDRGLLIQWMQVAEARAAGVAVAEAGVIVAE